MSGLAPMDRREERTLPSLSSLFGNPLPRPSSLGVSQAAHAQAFPQRAPSPHFSGILRPVNSLHNLANYGPPGTAPQPPPQVNHSVRELPALDRVHISAPPPPNSFLAPPPTHNIFSAAPAYRPAPAAQYPPFLHGRTASQSTATTNTDAHSNRSSTAFSTSNATSVTDLSSVRSSTISRSSSSKIVGVQDVPGEGEHYVYEDGRMMKAMIGGERVNPAWGITKAGKPRKRLAKACMTCREKKIKCEQGEPGDSRCGQCARTNRVCRIPQDPRSSPEPPESSRSSAPGSAGTLPPPPLSEERLMLSQGLHDNTTIRKRTHDMLHINGVREPGATTPTDEWLLNQSPTVRGEHGRAYFQDLTTPTGAPAPSIRRRAKQSGKGRLYSAPRAPPRIDPGVFSPQVDPYLADPEATIYFLELFFYFRNKGPYASVPREPFFTWVRATRDKSVDDLMMVYASMAFGARFGIDKDVKDCGKTFHDIAFQLERQRTSRYSLQLIHTRTSFIFYYFSLGDFESAFEYTANAVRALSMLRYQDENTITSVLDEKGTYEYGMTAQQLRECRRRTFWIVWMVDRYNSFSFGSMGLLHDAEVFLRMPCTDHEWLHSLDVQMPFFRGDSIHDPYKGRPGDMAMLVDIVRLWGHVTAHAYSSINRDAKIYAEYYDNYYAQTREELRSWVANLPEELRFSNENMSQAISKGYFSQFYIIHAIYCLVGMKLGRIGRVEFLSDEIRRRNLRVALYHARIYLNMVTSLSKAIFTTPGDDIDMTFSQPFPGYAVTNAVDIISSGGRATSLAAMTNNELEAAKMVVEQKANFWVISKKQQQLIDDRQGLLSAYGINGGYKTDRYRVPEAIDRSFLPAGHDMVYEIPDDIFFEVVLDETNKNQDPLGILN